MPFRLGIWEILLILVIVLLLFGATRLPQLAHSIGKAIREFQKGIRGKKDKEGQDISDSES